MRKFKTLWMVAALAVTAAGMQSCNNDDDDGPVFGWDNGLPTVVTVKAQPNGGVMMQLDDSTTVYPVNMQKVPNGKSEQRVMAMLRTWNEKDGFDDRFLPADGIRNVYVMSMDTILNKTMAPDLGAENAKKYGNDPVEIMRDWKTGAEDGYLTLVFATRFGGERPHRVNLVATPDGDNHYVVTLHHDAAGDVAGPMREGIVAFKLDQLPATGGKTVTLTLKWRSYSGEKKATFRAKL